MTVKKHDMRERLYRYALRKTTRGVGSVAIAIFATGVLPTAVTVQANEVAEPVLAPSQPVAETSEEEPPLHASPATTVGTATPALEGLKDQAKAVLTFEEGSLAGGGGSLQGNQASLTGQDPHFGASLTLGEGADNALKLPNYINTGQQDSSFAFWFNADSSVTETNPQASAVLLQQGESGRTILSRLPDGRLNTYINAQNATSTGTTAADQWQHAAFVVKQEERKGQFFINGVLDKEVDLGAGKVDAVTSLIVGAHKTPGNLDPHPFRGKIDDLYIFEKALTADEVTTIYAEKALPMLKAEQLNPLVAEVETALADLKLPADHPLVTNLQANLALAKRDLTDLNQAKRLLSDLRTGLTNYRSHQGQAVDIRPDEVLRTIDSASIFGINHRYAFNGYGSFDQETGSIRPDFKELFDKVSFGSFRYPGGTISNLFNWKTSVGPVEERKKQIHGFYNNPNQGGIAPNFGLAELISFAKEADSEIVYVYSLGRGNARDVADLIEYFNAEVGTNVNGGIDWAAVRASQGHPDPVNIRFFEIGNEMQQGGPAGDGTYSQQYWVQFVPGKSPDQAYIEGGRAVFNKQYAVKEEDWNARASVSDGTANQVRYMRYANVNPKTLVDNRIVDDPNFVAVNREGIEVFVGQNDRWRQVTDLTTAGATDKVYQIDYSTGAIKFGDGVHGAIPTAGEQIYASYSVEKEGFLAMSRAIKETMAAIDQAEGKTRQANVYTSFESRGFIEKMAERGANDWYDGMTIHPYSGTVPGGSDTRLFYDNAMKKAEEVGIKHVEDYLAMLPEGKVPVISEFGIFRNTEPQLRSLTHALYIAKVMMSYVQLGSPYIQKHTLVDWYSSGADSLGPTQQAVIQAVARAGASTQTGTGEFDFFATPSAHVLQMYNAGFGNEIIAAGVASGDKLANGVTPVSLLASKDKEGHVYIAAVNVDRENDRPISLNLEGIDLTGKVVEVQELTSADIADENTIDDPDKVRIVRSQFTAEEDALYTLKKHSFVVFKIKEALPPRTEEGTRPSETTLQLRNVARKIAPTSNSKTLIESSLSTIPSVQIANPQKATDGSRANSGNDENNTKIIAGRETGSGDNGYSNWESVYLQYDLGKVHPIEAINIYRNTYANAISTFKNVKVEVSTTPDFSDNVHVLFEEGDLVETAATKGAPQILRPAQPIDAQYVRVWGRGHYIQNTNSSWAGYSNGVLINELEVMAKVEVTEDTESQAVNLAKLKAPYVYGLDPTNLAAINDGKFDNNYAVHNTVGNSYLQYEFKRAYNLQSIRYKLQPGVYRVTSVALDSNPYPNDEQEIFRQREVTVDENTIFEVSLPEGTQSQYVRFRAQRADGRPVGYSEIEILGTGDSYDEAMPPYVAPTSRFNKLVWSDEFDGDAVDESKWQIIDGMVNHAAIYNRGAVSIKKDGDKSYLSIRSKNYDSTKDLIDAVGIDRYDDKALASKITWSSGRVESKDKYAFQYGRMAVRAKVNDSKGIWPAIWMLAQDETGHDEIDVLEYLGHTPWQAWTTNHFGILAKNKEAHGVPIESYEAWSQNFHVYEVEWTPTAIKWFIDGHHVFTSERGRDDGRDGMHSRPMFPILETQVGDGWVGDVDYSRNETKQDSEYLIDWIRVYQEEGQDQVYFDNLDNSSSSDSYFIRPKDKLGKLVSVSDGTAPHENKNHFYYGGQPRYETSRLYAQDNQQENALVYEIHNPSAVHLTTYYKTLEDYKVYNGAAWADEGKSIRKHLVGAESIDFKVYSSTDGQAWRAEAVSVVDNFVEATPAYARTTFDVKKLSDGARFVKIVFPTVQGRQYTLNNGQRRDILSHDVQLAKVTFTAPEGAVPETPPVEQDQPGNSGTQTDQPQPPVSDQPTGGTQIDQPQPPVSDQTTGDIQPDQPQPTVSVATYRESRRPIAFAVEYLRDPHLPIGTEAVLREGRPGQLVVIYEDTVRHGYPLSTLWEIKDFRLPISKIVRIGTRPVSTKATRPVVEPIAFTTERIPVAHLESGREVVVREGVSGRVTKVYEDQTTAGQTTTRLIELKDRVEPVSKLILVGTRPIVTSRTVPREVVETLPMLVERVETSTLDIGQERIVREGRAGRLVKVYEDTYTNGLKTGERLVEIKETLVPIKQLILVGTRPKQVSRTQIREAVESLPLEVERVVTTALKPGEEKVLRQGRAGHVTKVYEDTYTNGVLTQVRVLEIKEVVTPVKTLILVGAPAVQPSVLNPSPAVEASAIAHTKTSHSDGSISNNSSTEETSQNLDSAPLAMSAAGLLSTLGFVGLKKSDQD